MKKILLVVGIFCTQEVFGQQTLLDSLQKVLQNNPKIDTNYCNILNEIAFNYWNQSPDSTIRISEKSRKICEKINFLKGKTEATKNIGAGYLLKGQYDKAIPYFQEAIKVAEKHRFYKILSGCYNNMAIIQNNQAKYEEALQYHKKALNIRRQTQDSKGVSYSLNNMAVIYQNQGKYALALQYQFEGLKIREEIQDKVGIAMSLGNIANIYGELEDYPQAFDYQQKALKMREEIGDKIGMIQCNINLGLLKEREKKWDEALVYLLKAEKISNETKDEYVTAHLLNYLGNIYLEKKDLKKAKQYFDESKPKMEKNQDDLGLSSIHINLAKVYLAEKILDKALEEAKAGFELAKKIGYKENIKLAHQILSEIYEAKGNLKDALGNFKLFKQYADSLKNDETEKKTQRLQAKYEFEQKESILKAEQAKKNAEYERKTAQQRWIIFSTFLLIAALLLITWLILRSRKKIQASYKALTSANEQILQQKEEIGSQAEELKVINQQLLELDAFKQNMTGMIVHDLKNPLNALLNIAPQKLSENSSQVQSYTRQMQQMVLNILDVQKFEEADAHLLKEEIFLNQIVDEALLQTKFLSEQKNIIIQTTSDTTCKIYVDIEMMTRVIVNLLTNAIKYSNFNQKVWINISSKSQKAFFSIQDEGKGIPADKLDKIFDKFVQVDAKTSQGMRSTGLGLTFCKMAIEAHEGAIGVESEYGKGTKFWFELPLLESVESESTTKVIIPQVISNSLHLTEDEKNYLSPYYNALQAQKVYYKSDLEAVLEKITFETDNLKNWEIQLKNAIYTMNQELFEELVNEIKKKE